MAGEHVLTLTDDNFESEVLQSDMPAMVDFWAQWCMPCKMIAPTIDKLAEEFVGRVKVGKVDTDSNREISLKFGISAIPTIILFKDGQMVKKFMGAQEKNVLKQAIEELL